MPPALNLPATIKSTPEESKNSLNVSPKRSRSDIYAETPTRRVVN
jgi:hypothetical protein